jgi:DNA-binding LacI/PurR family transcriptional regulator/biotin operon repressor
MAKFEILNAGEQVAKHLREELARGVWTGVMPGEDRLMKRLGVGRATIKAALKQLEDEGLLVGRGVGHRRRIIPPKDGRRSALRIRLLLYEKIDRGLPDHVELLAKLQEAGFAASFAEKSLRDLGMKPERVGEFVVRNPADAWVVTAGSREVLEWFSLQSVPVIAMYGRFSGLPIAASAPRKIPAMLGGIRQFVALGHRRIVMLTREDRRKPMPGPAEQAFLDELALQGLPTGSYNLPDWEDSRAGFHKCLTSLYERTPPSALIIGDRLLYNPVQQFLAARGIRIPQQVSLFCLDPDPSFAWCEPMIAHIEWDHRKIVRRIVKWAENVSRGRNDRKHGLYEGKLVAGGTIGPLFP